MVAKAYPDYCEIGAGCKRLLSYGAFDADVAETDLLKRPRLLASGRADGDLVLSDVDAGAITEHVRHSWYADDCAGHPSQGKTEPVPEKAGAYSWLKSPRYDGDAYEVGPLARMVVNYLKGNETVKTLVDAALSELGAEPAALFSTAGRHAARALECKMVADAMAAWVLDLRPGEATCATAAVPECAEGAGLVDGPRGALGHWIRIEDRTIANYQMVVPTTWNGGPRDANDQPGPIEQALEGAPVPDAANPFAVVRVIRSFDPCLACSVHVMTPRGGEIGRFRIL
jgi:hydrogenase large subunit